MAGCGGCGTGEVSEVEQKPVDPNAQVVIITEKAADKVREFMKQEKKEQHGLRILVSPGGCAGFQYGLEFDDKKDGDTIIEDKGIKILVDKESAQFLTGTEIDFIEGLHGTGFKVNNPNAQKTCGCGNSFS